MGPAARVSLNKKLASAIVSKHNKVCSRTLNWWSCSISFSLLRSDIMCLRASSSSGDHSALPVVTH